MKERIGLFGGTFNPIHNGHIRAAEEVRAAFGLDRVLFIPSYIPPHKSARGVASAEDRFRMVRLACEGRAGFVAFPIEVEARETSYSIVTLDKVRSMVPDAWLFFILGVDAFLEIGTWREYERVLEECLFVVTGRPGFALDPAGDVLGGRLRDKIRRMEKGETADESWFTRFRVFLLPIDALDVSSTDIRARLGRGEPPGDLVPAAVAGYIRDHQLYTD